MILKKLLIESFKLQHRCGSRVSKARDKLDSGHYAEYQLTAGVPYLNETFYRWAAI